MLKTQFIKFLFVGILNTIVGYSFYAFFLFIGCDYKMAALIATILGVAFNFKSTGILVFKSHKNSLIFRFVGVYTVIFFFNLLVIKCLKIIGFNDYIAGAISLVPAAVLSFSLNKFWVFKK